MLPTMFRYLSTCAVGAALSIGLLVANPLRAEIPGLKDSIFRQAVAEAAYGSESSADFYRLRGYETLFTGPTDIDRRAALIEALQKASAHGLPAARYDAKVLVAAFRAAHGARARGKAEGLAAKMLLAYAKDIHSGALEPRRIDSGIVRKIAHRDPAEILAGFASSADPRAYLRSLAPQSTEYARLMAERMRLDHVRTNGGWGPQITAERLNPGDQGPKVVEMRNRLIAMGYLDRTATDRFNEQVAKAVQAFQRDHGLNADGVAGASTIRAMNVAPDRRLASVLVAMERERWLSGPRGQRHVLVNLVDYTAKILDDDKVTFETRSVIGETDPDKRTPEFSDMMKYVEINPDWTVPRGIIRRDYLPRLQANPGALRHLKVVDSRGRVIPRNQVNFAAYTARNFPFSLRQPPGPRNALGTVKFMFPNKYAIYLHDTPDKSLFGRERRAFSNGCIRLNDPHEFAYAILAKQSADPKALFDGILRSRQQKRVYLDEPVPVHLIYRTAFTRAKGRVNYRGDVYGRDGKIWSALRAAGVKLDPLGS